MLLTKRIPVPYILNKVKLELFSVGLLVLFVLALTNKFQKSIPDMPFTIPAFIGTAISILLSFKLNQSYDRWWEARKVWGSIVNDSRSLVLQLQTLVAKGNDEPVKRVAYRQIAWCYCLGQSLRKTDAMANLEKFLDAEDLEKLKTHSNKPLGILQQNAFTIKDLREHDQLPLFSHIQIDETLVRLCDSQGKAERIKTTIFPVTYRLFLHFIIYLFIITVSISLKNIAWYFEIPLLLLISMAFFFLEKSATLMQDPFENKPTDTAMTAISRNIEINIKELLQEQEVPEPIVATGYYIL